MSLSVLFGPDVFDILLFLMSIKVSFGITGSHFYVEGVGDQPLL